MPRLFNKHVCIRSRRPHHPALRCDGHIVLADQFENVTKQELWTLHYFGNDRYHITYSGLYGKRMCLQASPDGNVFCGQSGGHHNYEWKIEYTRKGYVSIKSCFNKYLCADENFRVTANREHCELWEQWAIVDEPHVLTTPTREVYIRCCQQQLFRDNDGLPALSSLSVKANRYGTATDGEKWHVMCVNDNKILLKSRGGFLSSDENDTKAIISSERQPWTIENVDGASIPTVAIKSKFGRYLGCENDDHIMCDGSVEAKSDECYDKRTWWVFLTDPSDINGNMALDKDAITMKDNVDEYA